MKPKNNMICDLETGVCGPGGDDTNTMEFIDFSAPKKSVELILCNRSNLFTLLGIRTSSSKVCRSIRALF